MVLYTTVVIRGSCLWYNSSNIRYIFSNKLFKAFLKHQMYKDKPTPPLAIKMWKFYTTLTQWIFIFFTHNHLFFYSIFSTSVTTSDEFKSLVTFFKKKRCIYTIKMVLKKMFFFHVRVPYPLHQIIYWI